MNNNEVWRRIERLEREIMRLKDIEAIRNLKAEHALASDDPENLAKRLLAIVTDDIELDYGASFGVHKGIDVFRELVKDTPFLWTIHYMIPNKIILGEDGDTAIGNWYLLEPASAPDPKNGSERAMWLGGVYEDRYRKMATGEWKICRMKFDTKLLCTYDQGWEKDKIVDLANSRWTDS